MKIEVIGGYGGESADCRMTCLLINDRIALDAGSLSQALPIESQVAVDWIVLSHSHLDHTNSLPFVIENIFGRRDRPLDVHTSAATIYAIRKYLLNNATWPDFTLLPSHLEPVVNFREIFDETPIELDGVRFTPIPVSHPVPTHGFLIEEGDSAFLWSSDTGPTQRLWEVANGARNLKAISVETSFDNAMQEVADVSLHLTPRTLERELAKLERKVPILLHHMKPPCVGAIRAEVKRLANPDIDYFEQGRVYEF
jgi:ribonuclease BN (tRNA processing enzyme)